jgi:hypothetical protein
MTSTATLLSAGEILKQDNLGRVLTPLAKRQEILAAFKLGVSVHFLSFLVCARRFHLLESRYGAKYSIGI